MWCLVSHFWMFNFLVQVSYLKTDQSIVCPGELQTRSLRRSIHPRMQRGIRTALHQKLQGNWGHNWQGNMRKYGMWFRFYPKSTFLESDRRWNKIAQNGKWDYSDSNIDSSDWISCTQKLHHNAIRTKLLSGGRACAWKEAYGMWANQMRGGFGSCLCIHHFTTNCSNDWQAQSHSIWHFHLLCRCIVLSLSPSLFGCPFPCTSPFVVNLQIPRQWSDECSQIVGDICRPWFFSAKRDIFGIPENCI